MKPFVKWAGGKRELADHIINAFPQNPIRGRYVEPFVGGGAILFRVLSESIARRALIADNNPHLIALYAAVRSDPDRLVREYDALEQSERGYYNVRDHFNNCDDGHPDIPAAFLYLNRLGFNGLCRYNKAGKYNVSWGKHKRRVNIDLDNLRSCSSLLQRTEILCSTFDYVLPNTDTDDLIYADPPYIPLPGKRNFTQYFDSFGEAEQRELAYMLDDAAHFGADAITSNSWCDESVQMYQGLGFDVHQVMCSRKINSKAGGRNEVPELLAVKRGARGD